MYGNKCKYIQNPKYESKPEIDLKFFSKVKPFKIRSFSIQAYVAI